MTNEGPYKTPNQIGENWSAGRRSSAVRIVVLTIIALMLVFGPIAFFITRQAVREHQRREEVRKNLDHLREALEKYQQKAKDAEKAQISGAVNGERLR